MRGGTLFSGICAPETACPEIDWRWRAEIDPFANAVAEYRHPGIPNLGNVEEIDPDATEPVDLVVFGSPCQSFSVAGKRLGLDDPRGNLALVALSLIGRLKPAWFVFENVPGLLSSDGGRDFGALLGVMGELGYGFAYRVLDAQFFGVPQRRRRVFVVGYLGDWRPPAAVLFERESLSGNPPPRREAWEGVAGTIAAGAHPGGYNGQDAYSGSLIAHSLRADGFDASEDGTGRGTPLVPVPIDMRQASRGGRFTNNRREGSSGGAPGTGIGNPGDPCPTLADSHTPAIAFSCKDHGADASELAPTLRAMPHDGSHANAGGQVAVAYNSQVEIRHGDAEKTRSVTVLRALRDALGEEAAQQWKAGVDLSFQASEVLRHDLHGGSVRRQADEAGCGLDDGALSRAEGMPAWPLSEVWQAGRSGRAPRGRGLPEQLARELDAALSELSSQGAQGREALHDLWRQAQSLGPLQSPLHPAQGRPPLAVRRLTPREAERLQGFPDDYTLVPYRGRPAADGPRYRALGNSMAVPVMHWILSRVLACDALLQVEAA